MPEELIMRGNTPSGTNEVLNFTGHTPGYVFRLIDFDLYPSTSIGDANGELCATITAANTYEDPANPNFNNAGLIGTAVFQIGKYGENNSPALHSVVNDLFYITQDLIIAVVDTQAGSPMNVNWQCRFEKVKLSGGAEAVANFNQFTIADG